VRKLVVAAALALVLGTGVVSAQETDYVNLAPSHTGAPLKQRLAFLKAQNAFGINTTSASSRNVGPSSSTTANPDGYLGGVLSGMPSNPRAPTAGSVSGGN
jgi:hypothetical protein